MGSVPKPAKLQIWPRSSRGDLRRRHQRRQHSSIAMQKRRDRQQRRRLRRGRRRRRRGVSHATAPGCPCGMLPTMTWVLRRVACTRGRWNEHTTFRRGLPHATVLMMTTLVVLALAPPPHNHRETATPDLALQRRSCLWRHVTAHAWTCQQLHRPLPSTQVPYHTTEASPRRTCCSSPHAKSLVSV